MSHEIIAAISALGGLSGLGALLASLASLTETRQRLRPNHGSSLADAVKRIEVMVKSTGHQIGEVRTEQAAIRADISDERRDRRLWDEALSDRVTSLETKCIE